MNHKQIVFLLNYFIKISLPLLMLPRETKLENFYKFVNKGIEILPEMSSLLIFLLQASQENITL